MVRKDTYSQPSASLRTQLGPMGTSLGTVLKDKWMKADAGSLAAMAGGAAASDSAALMTSFDSSGSALDQSIPAGSTLTRVPGKAVNGIQTTGAHLVLSHWSQKVIITAPPKAQVVTHGRPRPHRLSGAGDLASRLSGLKW